MLLISRHPTVQVTTINLNLEGKLLRPWIEEARAAVAAAKEQGAVRINLEELSFVDHAGIELLRNLRQDGIELVGGTAFIDGLLAASSQPG